MTRRQRVTDTSAAADQRADGARERTLRDVEREAQALGAQLLGRDRRAAARKPGERAAASRDHDRDRDRHTAAGER